MRKLRNLKKYICACFAACMMYGSTVLAMQDMMPLNQVKEGMHGVGYTVMDSSGELKSFDVDIVGIIKGGKGGYDRILARMSGPLSDATEGALQGMSGSPIYVDGKIIGALSASMNDTYRTTIFITPIENMVAVWELPDTKNVTTFPTIDLKKEAKQLKKEKAFTEKKIEVYERKLAEFRGEKWVDPDEDKDAVDNTADAGTEAADKGDNGNHAAEAVDKSDNGNHTTETVDKADNGSHAADKGNGADNQAPASAEANGQAAKESPVEAKDSTNTANSKEKSEGKQEANKANPAAEDKLKSEAKANNKSDANVKSVDKGAKDKTETKNKAAKAEADKSVAAKENKAAKTKSESLMAMAASGFSGEGFNFLQEKMAKLEMSVTDTAYMGVDIAGDKPVKTNASVVPGSAFGVAAIVGDFSVGAIGTVTATDGQKIVGFGHPFANKGNVNFFMTDAKILGNAHGTTVGMKLGEMDGLIGRINQDRSEAVAGIVGVFPQSVPVIVTVHDKELKRDITYHSAIAYNEEIIPALSEAITYGAIVKTRDRLGDATAVLKFKIRTNVMDDGVIERDNMFYSTSDVGKVAISELGTVLNMVCGNKEQEYNLTDIKVDVTLDNKRDSASIILATADKTEVLPGDTVNFKVVMKPYRGAKEVCTIPYTVPSTQPSGSLTLDIRGGGLISVAQLLAIQQALLGIDTSAEEDKTVTLQEQMKEALKSYKNNEIIIEPGAAPVPQTEEEQKEAIKEAKKKSDEIQKLIKAGKLDPKAPAPEPTRFSTDYIIDNVVHATLMVKKHN